MVAGSSVTGTAQLAVFQLECRLKWDLHLQLWERHQLEIGVERAYCIIVMLIH